jgi:hypothetical protein
MKPCPVRALSILALSFLLDLPLHAGDWTNNGGNAARNGLSNEIGPIAPDVQWSSGRSSIIAWNSVIVGDRLFIVRQTGFPPGGEPNGSPVVCYDLDSGAELWAEDIVFNTGDWTTWLAGASDGKVYASRSGNGASVDAKIHALDQTTGATIWTSTATVDAGPYDGVAFAPNGDLVVGNQLTITRIRASDGSTAWSMPRLCNVTSSCGPALFGDGVYVAEAAPGGNSIRKYDLDTGVFKYESPVMPGFTLQNTPFVGPEGTVYLSRSQNNVTVDFFYAFEDTGSALVSKWSVAAAWTAFSEYGCGPDGSVYMIGPGFLVERRDPDTGTLIDQSSIAIATSGPAPHFAVDRSGKVFLSNGGFSSGTLYSFNPDLSLRWSVPVTNINIGGPALGEDGTLVVAGVGTDLRAYRSDCAIAASAIARNAGSNPASTSASLPILGATFTATVDLSSTGHTSAWLFAFDSAFDFAFPGGQRLLCADLGGSGELLALAPQAGPLANVQGAIPNDSSLCGVVLCTQALHVGGVMPFALSNANDLIVGG